MLLCAETLQGVALFRQRASDSGSACVFDSTLPVRRYWFDATGSTLLVRRYWAKISGESDDADYKASKSVHAD